MKPHKKLCAKRGLLPATNSVCTVVKKIYDSPGFIIGHPYCTGISSKKHNPQNLYTDVCLCAFEKIQQKSKKQKQTCQDFLW